MKPAEVAGLKVAAKEAPRVLSLTRKLCFEPEGYEEFAFQVGTLGPVCSLVLCFFFFLLQELQRQDLEDVI